MENGIGCFITLCDSSYPRKLAFHYLQDLQKEFQKFDISLIDKITRPYSFVKFGNAHNCLKLLGCSLILKGVRYIIFIAYSFNIPVGFFFFPFKSPISNVFAESIIGNIRKQYVDTRTQANLSKLNANRGQDLDIVIEHMYQIVERKRQSGKLHIHDQSIV